MDAIPGHIEAGDEAADPPWRGGFGPIPKTEAGIKAAIVGRLHLEWDDGEQTTIGRDPRTLSVADLESLGHRKEPLLRLIRRNCIDCAGGNEAEVRRCGMVACPFWPYRMNTNPFHTQELTDERRQAMAERARTLRGKSPRISDPARQDAVSEAAEASGGSQIPAGTLPAGIAGAEQG